MPPKLTSFFYSYPALKRRAKNILLLWSTAKRKENSRWLILTMARDGALAL